MLVLQKNTLGSAYCFREFFSLIYWGREFKRQSQTKRQYMRKLEMSMFNSWENWITSSSWWCKLESQMFDKMRGCGNALCNYGTSSLIPCLSCIFCYTLCINKVKLFPHNLLITLYLTDNTCKTFSKTGWGN